MKSAINVPIQTRSTRKWPVIYRLVVFVMGMLIGMTLFELLKQALIPKITVWQSHLVTICFSSIAATVAAYFMILRTDRAIEQIEEEITTRRKTDSELRLSEEKLSKLFRANPDWVIISSLHEGLYIDVNNAFCRMSGYKRGEIIGHTSLELNIWVDPNERDEIIPILLQNGRISDHEVRFRMKSGEIRYMLRSAELIDLEGTAAIISVCKDITERKRAEVMSNQYNRELSSLQALGLAVTSSLSIEKVCKAALQGMIDAVQPDMAFLFLREGDKLILQEILPPEARIRLGAVPEHRVGECMCGLTVRDGKFIYSSDIQSDPRCTWDECKKAGIKSFASLPLRIGEEIAGVLGLASLIDRDFETQAGFLEMLAHQISMALANSRLYESVQSELAERKKVEKSLYASENMFRELFENVADPVYISDSRGKIISANNQACIEMGYSLEELLQLHIFDLDAVFTTPEMVASHFNELSKTGSVTFESRHQRKNGSQFPVEINARTFDMKRQQYVIGVARNLSERKRSEEERLNLEKQLLQAQKMELVGLLAGGVAHDFNNMLGVILGHTELALTKINSSDPSFSDLEEIRKAANRSADITRQLLTFARKQTVAPKVIELNETIEYSLKMMRRLIGEGIDLTWLPSSGLWLVKIDPSQIDQILANLCVNAREAIAGVGKITIETGNITIDKEHLDMVPGQFVRLTLSDNGCGMDKETLPHIFEPFFTTREFGKGTGLGLASVYGAVKQNNGFINVYSEPDQGTTFQIYLPRHIGETKEAADEGEVEPLPGGHEIVLLVEDETSILNVTQLTLEQLGYTILAANSPSKAIGLAENFPNKIDILVTDLIMPEMNGYNLAELLQKNRPKMKLLLMSGYSENVITNQGKLADGIQFIQKPFSQKVLAIKIREALDSEDRNLL